MAHSGSGAVDASIGAAVADLASQAGFDVEDVTVRLAGGRRLVRVVVDRDGGVDLDVAADLSRTLAAALDDAYDAALGDAAYTLEVTSRGIGAPLTEPRHFRRAAGRLATLTLRSGDAVRGRLIGVDGDDLVILRADDDAEPARIALADIATGKTEVEFTRPGEELAARISRWQVDLAGPDARPSTPHQGDARIEGNDAR